MEEYYNYEIKSKYDLVSAILKHNFPKDNFTTEGIMRVMPRRLDYYGNNYGWGDIETQHRFFIHMLNIKGYLGYLKDTSKA